MANNAATKPKAGKTTNKMVQTNETESGLAVKRPRAGDRSQFPFPRKNGQGQNE